MQSGTRLRVPLLLARPAAVRLLNRAEVLLLGVGDLDAEGVLERERHFNGGQAVSAEVLDEGGLVLDVLFLDAELLSDDFLDLLFDIVHFVPHSELGGLSLAMGNPVLQEHAGSKRIAVDFSKSRPPPLSSVSP